MVSHSTQATASSTKGFTLVELIVVITILAILGTIGFLSLQGYSGQSRDSKRTSDLRALVTSVSTKRTEGVGYLSMVSGNSKNITGNSIAGAGTSGSNYQAGTPNYTALGMNSATFKDPSGVDYVMGATTSAGGAFQIAAKLENGGTPQATVQGNFIARGTTALTLAANAVSGSANVTISAADIGKLKRGDTIAATGFTIASTPTISSISADGLTITLSTPATSSAAGTIALAVAETEGLIAGATATDVVVDGTTVTAKMPY